MMRIFFFIYFVFVGNYVFSQINYVDTFELPDHPRLLLFKGEEEVLKTQIKKSKILTDINNTIIKKADTFLNLPNNKREKIGRRILDISRDNLKRIFLLSYAYRMTGEKKYYIRAEKEMLSAASFEDWNPEHFLDVAEMTMALSIGYDWLYDRLSDKSKKIIRNAITEKGILPSLSERFNKQFIGVTHNWNQVCHAGLSYGAIAVWDSDKLLSNKIINRAINDIKLAMKQYGPDGAYPEGPDYWDYGTSFNVMFLSAIDKIYNTDFGLSRIDGFLKTAEYILNVQTPSMKNFNYSDSGTSTSFTVTPFWFYNNTKDITLLYNQKRLYERDGLGEVSRLAPAMLIWSNGCNFDVQTPPHSVFWKADGENSIACMRSEWRNDNKAKYLGVKLGSPSVNHGHMDIGSFIFESDGIDWFVDPGKDYYHRLETLGVDLWNMEQGSQRWDIFRNNNFAHNTVSFNSKKQLVDGKAEIIDYSNDENNMFVVSDLTSVYKNEINSYKRSFSLIDKSYVVIEDEVLTKDRFTNMQYTFVTKAKTALLDDDLLLLYKDDKMLFLRIDSPFPVKWNITPAKSKFSFDSSIEGLTIINIGIDLDLSNEHKFIIFISSENNKKFKYEPVIR